MNWTKKIIFFLIPFIVVLMVAEVGLRFFFPILDPFVQKRRPVENFKLFSDGTIMPGISGTTTFTTDELGFRTTSEIAYLKKPEKTIRIFFVGGSTTEQLYVDNAKEFVGLLQGKLNNYLNKNASSYQSEAINTGRSGLLSVDHLRMARELEKYKPDYMVFMMGINDLGAFLRTKGAAADLKHYYGSKDRQTWRYIITRSQVLRLLFHTRAVAISLVKGEVMDKAGQQYSKKRKIRAESPEISLEEDLKGVPQYYYENIVLISDFLKKSGIQGIFLTQQTMWFKNMSAQLDALLWMTPSDVQFKYETGELDALMEKYNNVLRHAAEQNSNIDLLDLSKLLPKDTTVFYDDVHFNDSGAEKISELLLNYFMEQFKRQNIL